jgi:hypothetical protein
MEITYESLYEMAKSNGYTDHVYHMKTMADALKKALPLGTFFEWGCGHSTKLFLEQYPKVVSVEIVTPGTRQGEWLHECRRRFGNDRWYPVILESAQISAACGHQGATHTDYGLINPEYKSELKSYLKAIQIGHDVSVVFVDPGVVIRGDLVEIGMQCNVPIVAAHDIPVLKDDEEFIRRDVYGWTRIKHNPEYTKVHIIKGSGLAFWIRNDLPGVIDEMQAYAKQIG